MRRKIHGLLYDPASDPMRIDSADFPEGKEWVPLIVTENFHPERQVGTARAWVEGGKVMFEAEVEDDPEVLGFIPARGALERDFVGPPWPGIPAIGMVARPGKPLTPIEVGLVDANEDPNIPPYELDDPEPKS